MSERKPAARVLAALLKENWAIKPSVLQTMAEIAQRQNAPFEALEHEIGRSSDNQHPMSMADGVATINVIGPLFRYASMFTDISGGTGYSDIGHDLAKALKDDSVEAIVLNVNSPGGEVDGCGELADMVFAARGKKPIVAYVGGMACSAAYWIASAADRIVADESAIVGSIGVVSSLLDTKKRQEMEGVKELVIVSSGAPEKIHGYDGITDEAVNAILHTLNALEASFVGKVSRNRAVTADTVRADFGRGGVFVAGKADGDYPSGLEAGLVDSIGNFEDLIASMKAGAAPGGTMARKLTLDALLGDDRSNPKVVRFAEGIVAVFARPAAEQEAAIGELLASVHADDDMGGGFCEADRSMLKECHAMMKTNGEHHMTTHAKLDKMDKKMDDQPTDQDPAGVGSQHAALPTEIEALTGKSGAEAVGIVTAWQAAFNRLPAVESELTTVRSSASAGERKVLIDGMLANGKLVPAQRQWAESADLATLKGYENSAVPRGAPVREPAGQRPTGSGGPAVTADMLPTDPATRKAFLLQQFEMLPDGEKASLKKTGIDVVAYMERRIARTDKNSGEVVAFAPEIKRPARAS